MRNRSLCLYDATNIWHTCWKYSKLDMFYIHCTFIYKEHTIKLNHRTEETVLIIILPEHSIVRAVAGQRSSPESRLACKNFNQKSQHKCLLNARDLDLWGSR